MGFHFSPASLSKGYMYIPSSLPLVVGSYPLVIPPKFENSLISLQGVHVIPSSFVPVFILFPLHFTDQLKMKKVKNKLLR